ncbi:sn-glycerol-3-phosphate ABC transporter permease UgpA [Phyllobacterium endophyticum]|uniref:sn-glycerol-3-phosphate transport system permease protein UgpA n=1 Tax=Phyllobacterium endophyticum TaxID=1149773 RepID=A0A2P7AQU3_9HYPH|nr:sn-glycerol-3-phosphate ABC transporter permease UgpA [Phyllobacterium endophyticum]MBB3237227.1 sn-glycerol 3-phosphate transport system permease protein [Phyllobacterium endophyticum]PSH56606.1 sn-glycerol-3-phosphate ABC transporter permease UgpA [Phyllobacterium endophyticum]TYR44400.1 sn-glycerol-3-phosphate ABC transporter permease UgpA [Phyllobacterium endophyticum]
MDGSSTFNGHKMLPYILLAPQAIILIVFFFWPAGQAVKEAFFITDPFGQSSQFVAFENFHYLLGNAEYYEAIYNSVAFAVAVTVLSMGTAFVLAFIVDRTTRGKMLTRTLLIWPYAVAPAIAGILWLFLFHPTYGAIANLLISAGWDWNPLLNGTQAFWLVVGAAAWKQISYNFVFFLAGFQAIPKSLLEAAAIDGAGVIRRTVSIVLPLMAPTTFFLITMNVVYAFFETFGLIDAITSGGPGGATMTLVYRVYLDGFKSHDIGGSAAQSVILMVIVGGLTFIQFAYIEKRISYR